MKKIKTRILTFVFAIFAVATCAFIATAPAAMADGYDESYLLRKALIQDLYTCYEKGGMKSSVGISSLRYIADIASDADGSDGAVKLPNGFTGINDSDLRCAELIAGYPNEVNKGTGGSFDGLIPNASTPFNTESEKVQVLEKLAYQPNANSAKNVRCANFALSLSKTANAVETDIYDTDQLCAYVDNNNNILGDASTGNNLFIGNRGGWQQGSTISPVVVFTINGNQVNTSTYGGVPSMNTRICDTGENFDTCINRINDDVNLANLSNGDRSEYYIRKSTSYQTTNGQASEFTTTSNMAFQAATNIFGTTERTFTTPEVISLYQAYLNKFATVQCTTENATGLALTNQGYVGPFVGVINGEKKEGCYAKEKDEGYPVDHIYYGVSAGSNGSLWNWSQDNKSFSDIVKFLSDNSGSNSRDLGSIISLGASDTDGQGISEDTSSASDCYSSSSALGWILCPIVEATANAVNGLYEKIVEPFLKLDVGAFNFDGGIYQAWQTFQSIANIIFVILFLVTIFSQLTGIGIDNLGIKRILPKLIIAAILVNLSYIVCEVLVDASNIVGFGAFRFFENISVQQSASVSTTQSAVTSFATLALGGTATAAGVATAWLWGPALVLPIVLTLIALLLSIIFMFVLLGARQAGVIILVITSPVAFVLYMLPNTKPIFDRWKKFFTALLLLYPLCGLLMGGSKFAGEVVMKTSDDFWPSAIASLLSVVAFFFIPTLLSSSMMAVGNLGARLSGFGQNLSRGAQNAARGGMQQSRSFKNMQERTQMRMRDRERRRLEGVVSRINRTPDSVRTDAQRRQLQFAQSQLNRMTMEDADAEVGVKALDREQAITAARSKQFNTEVDAIGTQLLNEGIAGKTGDLKAKSFNEGTAFEEGSLSDYIMNLSDATDDDAARYAAVKQLMASGHHGETAVHQVMQRLADEGRFRELSTVARAVKTDRNFGGLKGAARSTYDFVNALENGDLQFGTDQNGNGQVLMRGENAAPDSIVSRVNFDNMSEEGLVSTNKEELERYLTALESGQLSREKVARLQSLAQSALSNERLASRRKGAVEEILKDIVNKQPHPNIPAHPLNAAPDETFNVNDSRNFNGPGNNSGESGI